MKTQQIVSDDELHMKVNLHISGRNLKDLDYFSKSDPVCRVYMQRNNEWVKLGVTERIDDNLNPDF